MRFVDVGCGFGGLLVRLSPLFPDTLMLGMELRDKARPRPRGAAAATLLGMPVHKDSDAGPKDRAQARGSCWLRGPCSHARSPPRAAWQPEDVQPNSNPTPCSNVGQGAAQVAEYVKERVLALRREHPGQFGNIACVRTNTQKYLTNFFFKAQLTKLFFLFPARASKPPLPPPLEYSELQCACLPWPAASSVPVHRLSHRRGLCQQCCGGPARRAHVALSPCRPVHAADQRSVQDVRVLTFAHKYIVCQRVPHSIPTHRRQKKAEVSLTRLLSVPSHAPPGTAVGRYCPVDRRPAGRTGQTTAGAPAGSALKGGEPPVAHHLRAAAGGLCLVGRRLVGRRLVGRTG